MVYKTSREISSEAELPNPSVRVTPKSYFPGATKGGIVIRKVAAHRLSPARQPLDPTEYSNPMNKGAWTKSWTTKRASLSNPSGADTATPRVNSTLRDTCPGLLTAMDKSPLGALLGRELGVGEGKGMPEGVGEGLEEGEEEGLELGLKLGRGVGVRVGVGEGTGDRRGEGVKSSPPQDPNPINPISIKVDRGRIVLQT
jgi:hypothetical protein